MRWTRVQTEKNVVLYVSRLKKYFKIDTKLFGEKKSVKAVDNVTFYLREGETLGVVGETGCGKTTLGRTILRLTDATDGNVYFDLEPEIMNEIVETEERIRELQDLKKPDQDEEKELHELLKRANEFRKKYSLTKVGQRELTKYRKNMQPIFQDPFSSLDPRKLVKDIISEPMRYLTEMNQDQMFEKMKELIEEIGLSEDHLFRFPHEFSGGQRQRLGIARAISIEPKLLVLDEPTSALDVSVQAQILNLLRDIQRRKNMAFLFITHHLNVVKLMSDRVAVMYLGQLVELADTETLFSNMLHPYTKALLSAIPTMDKSMQNKRIILEGEIPSPADPPKGCYFHPRCQSAMRNCGWSPRDLVEPFREMLKPYNNKEAVNLPDITELEVDEANNQFLVKITSQQSPEETLKTIRNLVSKESRKKGGVRFTAIESMDYIDSTTIRVKMIEPDMPKLREIKKEHFVSCLLYEEGMNAPRAEDMEQLVDASSREN
jgi:oligopeptide/dipeptide ABC transporter ATP-binding protein